MFTTKIKIVLLLISIVVLFNSNSYSQNNPILDNFSIIENNGKVFLNWTIKSGSTCNGIQIFRSVNNSSFKEIGNIAGICGSVSAATPYSFTDQSPEKNTINYYRLELGTNGTSQTVSIEIIDIDKDGSQVRPNPVYNDAKIFYSNKIKELHTIIIYDNNGKYMNEFSSKEKYFEINSINYSNGMYFYNIVNNNKEIISRGKFIVLN